MTPLILYQDSTTLVVQTTAGEPVMDSRPYGAFNLGLHVGDDSTTVLANRATLLITLRDISPNIGRICWLNQIHSTTVLPARLCVAAPSADALMTDERGAALAIMTADCVPIALVGNTQVACVHAGWQGLADGIIQQTVNALEAGSIRAVIGACIGVSNYQVDCTLAAKIVDMVHDRGLVALSKDALYHAIVRPQDDQTCHLDLVALTKLQLSAQGVHCLTDAVPCTYDDRYWYSYRRQTHAGLAATGRMAVAVARL